MKPRYLLSALRLGAWMLATMSWAHAASSLYIEDMTSPELQAMVAAGSTTVLIPIGGTEQNGPHMVLGKHNVRARVLAGQIAEGLGHAVVAPVIAYVPEGSITPPVAHMRFAGTISLPDAVFEGLLEATARSFKQHGFRDIVFLGDHGGYQKSEERVAARLNKEWARDPNCRVLALTDYYRVTQTAYVAELKKRGFSEAEIGTHAGLADTALTLAIDPKLVRPQAMAQAPVAGAHNGVTGDPRRATADLGQIGVKRIVESSLAAIRAAQRAR
ncbi:MAG TPA: creatininase family protein [Aquabacterium sp.]|uniref:creatininase family protein n=1 Tax=Aquabacterium sp. TaxID=1872578 RepID=UPI002E37E82E|nr:creatininase family protein [Aquabacterium sp.]HEX5354661.1 creatininase family protein [Aquabacterium sp.]